MSGLNRRQFLALTGVGCSSALLPFQLQAQELTQTDKTLVLVEFNGGNDGLNTVIPFTDPTYYSARPTIAIAKRDQLPISESLAFHPALAPLTKLWEAQQMATVLGLGYAQPNRSHFRSIEIWDTASASNEYLQDGWLAQTNTGDYMADAIVIGRNAAPVQSANSRTIVLNSIESFYRQAQAIEQVESKTTNLTLQHLLKTQNDTKSAAEQLQAAVQQKAQNLPEFAGGEFGKQLREVARLILMGNTAPVIKVALGSFDTHQDQLSTQAVLLDQFAKAIASFHQVLEATGHWQQVMIMTYSEFGRRVGENGSGGTDHGTAAPHFVLGGQVKGGLYGTQPDLNDLYKGDLKYTTDFHRYYQTAANGFMGRDCVLSSQPLTFLR